MVVQKQNKPFVKPATLVHSRSGLGVKNELKLFPFIHYPVVSRLWLVGGPFANRHASILV